jgi:release factor glutamine methyltransferase
MQEIWTIQKVLNWTLPYFEKHQVPESRLSAELLLSHVLKCKRLDLYLQFDRILTGPELKEYRSFIERRITHEPVAYILGEKEFMGLNFKLTPDVLIPRPETEILVETALAEIKGREAKSIEVLDVGTGSGAIAISVGHYCRECRVTALDISPAAIEVARQNGEHLGVDNIKFLVMDALDLQVKNDEKYDYLLVNPPYIAERDRKELHPQISNYEPGIALFSGENGLLFYSGFIPKIPSIIKKGGWIFMEIGYDQKEKINILLKESNFSGIEFIPDYQKIERIAKARYE